MKDTFARIADICLDIGIIAPMLVSLFWNAPVFTTRETPTAALPEISDVCQP
jgi:hypothetical protein